MDWRMVNLAWVAPLLAVGAFFVFVVGAFLLGVALFLLYLFLSMFGIV